MTRLTLVYSRPAQITWQGDLFAAWWAVAVFLPAIFLAVWLRRPAILSGVQ